MATHPCSASDGNSTPRGPASARIDVWLWSVRQIKSRSAATSACKAGHVRINGETAKPAQHVAVGDEVRYRVDGFDRLLTVAHSRAQGIVGTHSSRKPPRHRNNSSRHWDGQRCPSGRCIDITRPHTSTARP